MRYGRSVKVAGMDACRREAPVQMKRGRLWRQAEEGSSSRVPVGNPCDFGRSDLLQVSQVPVGNTRLKQDVLEEAGLLRGFRGQCAWGMGWTAGDGATLGLEPWAAVTVQDWTGPCRGGHGHLAGELEGEIPQLFPLLFECFPGAAHWPSPVGSPYRWGSQV